MMPSSHGHFEESRQGIGNMQAMSSTNCRSHVQFGGFSPASRFSRKIKHAGWVQKMAFGFTEPALKEDLG
jgi:hypothetical protein